MSSKRLFKSNILTECVSPSTNSTDSMSSDIYRLPAFKHVETINKYLKMSHRKEILRFVSSKYKFNLSLLAE